MRVSIKRHLKFANVMSALAVFIVLGGSAFALGRNTVGTKQLKKGAVTTKKIKNNAVIGSKVDESTLHLTCPSGTTKTLGVCFESSPRAGQTYQSGIDTCAAAGRVLPTAQQLIAFARTTLIPATEMSGDLTAPTVNIDIGPAPGTLRSNGSTGDATAFRCVQSLGV